MAGRARPKLRQFHRRVLSLLARDITSRCLSTSTLVLAPHPDDETIACGGTIARKAALGTTVTVVIAADDGNEARRRECIEACNRLGLPEGSVRFLGLPDGGLARSRPELDAALGKLTIELTPGEIFAPLAIDNHPDHRALAAAVTDLHLERSGTPVHWYPVWLWNRWAWAERTDSVRKQRWSLLWRPLRFTLTNRPQKVDITDAVETKRHALAAHATQVGPQGATGFLDPDWLTTFLRTDEIFFATNGRRSSG